MCNHYRHPLHCILPPYMADKLNESKGENKEVPEVDTRLRNKRRMLADIPSSKKIVNISGAAAKARSKLYREVYDAFQKPLDIGSLIWKEGQKLPRKDKDAMNVITGAGHVWDFYKKIFNRNSIDNKGMSIIQTVRYRENPHKTFDNAFWDGEQMYYGTGTAGKTNSFTSDLDIIGHELSHGVIDYEARLEYRFQSGALNESLADVFGILIKQWVNNTPARKADWLIGKNILKSRNALRSLKAPGTAYKNDPIFGDDPQPALMKDFQHLQNNEDGDNGGVHINSGIPNFAFYVTAFELNGFAWEKAGAIWYAALTDQKILKRNSKFDDAAAATLKKAVKLFGKGSLEEKAVEKGWKTCGVI